MKAINTMTDEEYDGRLRDAAFRMHKVLHRLIDREASESRSADNAGDEDRALKHDFNARALSMAAEALLASHPVAKRKAGPTS